MSESIVENKKETPKTIYLKDYEVPPFLIDEIHLDFELSDEETIVASSMKIKRNPKSSSLTKDLILNGEELTLISIELNGQMLEPKDYIMTENDLSILNVPEQFELAIINKIYPEKNTALCGLYRSQKTYCTQCEPEGFRHITYFLDRPDVLSKFTTTITANGNQYPYLLSNGNLVASKKLDDGRQWVKWEDPFKKPSYLFALVAGDFDLVEDSFITQSKREVTLRIFAEKGYAEKAHHAMNSVKQAMRWDEENYGREYDLSIYMIVAIGDFNMGAMENKGLNIFNTKYVLAKPETATDDDFVHVTSVIGHEYFHNWTGNRVTCRDWFQLSLKEGLTIFRDQSFSGDMFSKAVMRIRDVNDLRETQFTEDAGPLAHQVRPDSYIEINNFYTATVYNKGAEVLRMLQTMLGKPLFRKGMDLYFEHFDGQAVTIEDFVKTMEEVSSIDLQQFRLWYSQAGTPSVIVQDDYDPAKKTYTLNMTQTCPDTPGQTHKKPFHIPIRTGLLDEKGNSISLHFNHETKDEVILNLKTESQQFSFSNVEARPIPSLLRNFSAPIKLNYAYSDADLLFLFKHDKDPFNRYEAGNRYLIQLILSLIKDKQQQKTLALPNELIETLEFILRNHTDDKLLIAEMLTIPSEKYIGEQMQVIDVDAIHFAREFVRYELANQLEKVFLETYEKFHHTNPYQFNMEEMGRRQLKNRCLSYLMLLPQHIGLGFKQFEFSLSVNMTDVLAPLVAFSNLAHSDTAVVLKQFYENYKQDTLVLDKWFSIQAASKLPNTLQQVKKLLQHPDFDIKNPNKVYALIGTFGYRNPIHFHAKNGEGYAFLRVMISQLDKLNPQVAARMLKPLTAWKRYDKERQVLMREQLEILLQDKKLSTDVYELVTKSLE